MTAPRPQPAARVYRAAEKPPRWLVRLILALAADTDARHHRVDRRCW